MNEIKKYYLVFKRWLWLLLLCAALGAGAGYLFSRSQTPIYQSTVRCLVSRAPDESYSDFAYLNDQQLALTYTQMIKSQPILEEVSRLVGEKVSSGSIKASVIAETQLIQITVEDPDPQIAARVANTLVEVFITYNSTIQSARFAESETSLQSQIAQMEQQISSMDASLVEVSSSELQDNILKAESELERLQTDILAKQEEISRLQLRLDELSTPLPTATPLPASTDQASLAPENPPATALPTAVATQAGQTITQLRLQINQKNLELAQMQRLYDLYQEIYTNLVVLGSTGSRSDIQDKTARMEDTLLIYRQIQAELLNSYETIRLARLKSTSNIVSYEPASIPSQPVRPNTPTNILLGAAVGLLLCGLVVFLAEYFDNSIRTPEEATQQLNLPVIGFIADIKQEDDRPYLVSQPRSPVAESFRALRTNLEYAAVDHPLKTIMVVSPHPSDGKTTISVNLAISMVQGGKRVMLVDADMRRPRVHSMLGADNLAGLSDLFRDPRMLVNQVMRLYRYETFSLVTAGPMPPNPADLLASRRMSTILEMIKSLCDVAVLDVPPFLVTDASILASQVDGVILVVRPGKTPMDSLQSTLELLKRANANILGLVFNRVPKNRSYYYGGYNHYSGRQKKQYAYYGPQGQSKGKGKGKN